MRNKRIYASLLSDLQELHRVHAKIMGTLCAQGEDIDPALMAFFAQMSKFGEPLTHAQMMLVAARWSDDNGGGDNGDPSPDGDGDEGIEGIIEFINNVIGDQS